VKALRVFLPQLIGAAITTAAITAAVHLDQTGHSVALIPAVATAIVAGAATFVTTLAKAMDDTSCPECAEVHLALRKLEQKNAELTQAIATLRLPE
jgi:hypothetical protein